MTGPYDDIINLPHHVSSTRLRMAPENRAAQFSPFAALTGHDAAVREVARQTEVRIELDENMIAILDMKLQMLADSIADHPEAAVTYFLPDEKKEGGKYVTVMGRLKKIDQYEGVIVMMNSERIPIQEILKIEGDLFKDFI